MTLLIAPCSTADARFAVMRWHYSRSMPVGKLVAFGVWENDAYIGAVIFGRGASPHYGTAFGLDVYQVAELVRVALTDHDAPVTQIIAETIRQLRAGSPGLRLLVSFADPLHDHHGGIYQAGNWVYTGTTGTAPLYRDPATGELLHNRLVSTTGMKRQFGSSKPARRADELELVEQPPKHRYHMPLDRAMRRQIEKLRQPAPAPVEHPEHAR